MKKTILGITIIIFIVGIFLFVFPVQGSPGANTYSMDFELSSSSHAYATDSADTSVTGDFTLEFWMKLDQLPSTAGTTFTAISKYEDPTAYSYILELRSANDKFWINYWSDCAGNTGTSGSSNAFTAGDVGEWVHIAVAVDASEDIFSFYKNAVHDKTTDSAGVGSVSDCDINFTIGARNSMGTPTGYFDGLIDDVRIWNASITVAQIVANYQTQLNGDDTDLVGYWMFNSTIEDKGEVTDPAGATADDLTRAGDPSYRTDVPFTGIAVEEVIVPGIIEF